MNATTAEFQKTLPAQDEQDAGGAGGVLRKVSDTQGFGEERSPLLSRRGADDLASPKKPFSAASERRWQRLQIVLLVIVVAALLLIAGQATLRASQIASQTGSVGQALMQSQRLAKSATQALGGKVDAFDAVKDSADDLSRIVHGLARGDEGLRLDPLDTQFQLDLIKIVPLVNRTHVNANTVLAQRETVVQASTGLASLAEKAQAVAATLEQQNTGSAESGAVKQLITLTQQIGKQADALLSVQSVSPDAAATLGKELDATQTAAQAAVRALLEDAASPHLRDARTRQQLEAILKDFERTHVPASAVIDLQGLASARRAQTALLADSEPLRLALDGLQERLSEQAGVGRSTLMLLAALSLLAVALVARIFVVQARENRARTSATERQRLEADAQREEAHRVNSANQSAILRLMNELQSVAEGDLTQQATVTEDITGAIADTVNYAVEELRLLVDNVHNTAARVLGTTEQVENASTDLLAASTAQLHEIRETGQSVLAMAQRINGVSAQAQESALVARHSRQAAASGLQAVQKTIDGMNTIRDQIQDTSKRIKRLGESSQEIGEITELISDITEQTNVLALNAAIQAASAGEAGRGFSVVAEEVQRLAERSADATNQIAALVKAIQTDTQDAVSAMERSTQGVVEGARLSDNAGTALSEIDSVSRNLAELIERISQAASGEANSANVVASSIQHIFAVTEQTGEGTRTTAAQVRELSQIAQELQQSVARFKIA